MANRNKRLKMPKTKRVKVKPQINAQMPVDVKQPTIIFIFGGSGDLTYRKLMPALYNLYLDNYLPQKFLIVGIGRTDYTNITFRNHSKKGVEEHSRRPNCVKDGWKEFSQSIEYIKADLESDKTYKELSARLKK